MTRQDLPQHRHGSRLRAGTRALGRVVLLLAVAWCLSAPPRRLVTIGPQQTVHTRNPKMGVHTRLTDEVEEWKIQRTFAMVREMGAPWVVEYFPWAYFEPRPGRYEWRRADMIVDHARAQGLRVIARIDYVPEWARPAETTSRYLDRDQYPDYARFVAAFAAHFAGRVEAIIIWNEPNLSSEWGYRLPDAAAYTELLRQSYLTIKAVAPEMRVLAAGLAPTMAPPGSEWGMDDLLYLEAMYQAGAGSYFDGLAMHAYGWTFPHDDPPARDQVNFRRVELLREIMVAHGDAHKRAYITEGGWNDHPRWAKAVRPYQRLVYTIGAYELALEQWDWCEAVALWAFRYPWDQRTYQDYYAFVTPDFVPKPLYTEVANYAHGRPYAYLEETR